MSSTKDDCPPLAAPTGSVVGWSRVRNHFQTRILIAQSRMKKLREKHREIAVEYRALVSVWRDVQNECKPQNGAAEGRSPQGGETT